jgi:hypothetical protein
MNKINDYSEINHDDIPIETLRKSLIENNEILLENLKSRFTQNLLSSMVFFIFNEICNNKNQQIDGSIDSGSNKVAEIFFSTWLNYTKKQAKKEILEINNQLKNKKINFLNAISNFSLPSTEDYQSLYDKAMHEVKIIFEKNTTTN